MNFKFSIRSDRFGEVLSGFILLLAVMSPLILMSCSKSPEQYQEEGLKAFAAGQYAKAQEYFADGIKKEGNTQLYAGFIAANLVTGKYPEIISAYNRLSDDIHSSLIRLYGKGLFANLGITTDLIPYKVDGGNQIPPDFPQTIALQANADFDGYITIKGQIDGILRK